MKLLVLTLTVASCSIALARDLDTSCSNDMMSIDMKHYGYVSCTNMNFEGSVCTYLCKDEFHEMEGPNNITCSNGEWSSAVPTCKAIDTQPCPRGRDHSDVWVENGEWCWCDINRGLTCKEVENDNATPATDGYTDNNGTKIVLEATPDDIKDGLVRTLTLRCSLQDTAASTSIIGRRDVTVTSPNVEEVSSLIVMRGGQDVASVSHSHTAHVMDGEVNLKVTGDVSNGGQGYLELTFDYPTVNNTGEFVCEASAVRGGHGVVLSTSAEVGFSQPTMADLVSYIRQNEQHKDQIQQRLDKLENETRTAVAFSAVLTKQHVTGTGQTLTYDQVYVNLGGGFNVNTGEFLCAVAGYYSFSMGAHINYLDNHVFLIMHHNDENILAMYASVGHGDSEMTFNSVIRKLAVGDVVKLVAQDTSSIFSSTRDRYASFSGHLLALA